MRIAAAARSLPCHSIGGMQAIAWDVLTGLARLGHRVTVMTTTIPGRDHASFEDGGVTVVPLEGTVPQRYSAGWWRESRRYAQRHLAGHSDAVLSISSAAAALLPLKQRELPVPFVFQAHGSSWAEAMTKWRSGHPLDWAKSARNVWWIAKDAGLYRRFDQLVFVGDALQRQFEKKPLRWMTQGVAQTTIANGVDTARFTFDAGHRLASRIRFGFGDSDRVLIFSGRLHAHKGAAEALRALAELRVTDASYRLLFIGDGGERERLKALARGLRCEAAVVFAGAVHREEMPALLCAGDALIFPALGREGLPLNVLEALSVGLPCVCADSLRETFDATPHIAFAPPRDAAAFAAAICAVVLRGETPSCRLPERYSLNHCVAAYSDLLQRSAQG